MDSGQISEFMLMKISTDARKFSGMTKSEEVLIYNDFREPDLRNDLGGLAENFVFTELNKKLEADDELYFWRTIGKQEVDFVLKKSGELIPIEVKYKDFKKPQITLGMKNFIKAYKSKTAIVATKNYQGFETIDKCNIYFIPAYLI